MFFYLRLLLATVERTNGTRDVSRIRGYARDDDADDDNDPETMAKLGYVFCVCICTEFPGIISSNCLRKLCAVMTTLAFH